MKTLQVVISNDKANSQHATDVTPITLDVPTDKGLVSGIGAMIHLIWKELRAIALKQATQFDAIVLTILLDGKATFSFGKFLKVNGLTVAGLIKNDWQTFTLIAFVKYKITALKALVPYLEGEKYAADRLDIVKHFDANGIEADSTEASEIRAYDQVLQASKKVVVLEKVSKIKAEASVWTPEQRNVRLQLEALAEINRLALKKEKKELAAMTKAAEATA